MCSTRQRESSSHGVRTHRQNRHVGLSVSDTPLDCLPLFALRHHKYPFDYAASEFGVSSQFNPTKMIIDGFAKLGLVSNRKRAVGAWSKLKARRDEEQSPGTAKMK